MGHVSYVPVVPSIAPGERILWDDAREVSVNSDARVTPWLLVLCCAPDGHIGNVPHIHGAPIMFTAVGRSYCRLASA